MMTDMSQAEMEKMEMDMTSDAVESVASSAGGSSLGSAGLAKKNKAMMKTPDGKVIQSGNTYTTPSGKKITIPTHLFPLQTTAWVHLQVAIYYALSLPINHGDFEEKYGTFADKSIIDGALVQFQNLNKLAHEFGDILQLEANLQKFENAQTAPKSLFGHTVWLTNKTINAANTVHDTLKEGLPMLAQEPTATKRLQDLKEMLNGAGGLMTETSKIKHLTATYLGAIGKYLVKFTNATTNKNDPKSLVNYVSKDDGVLKTAQTILSQDKIQIKADQDAIDEDRKEFIAFTVMACAAPLFMLVPIFGPVLAAADAIGFGVEAGKVKDDWDKKEKELTKLNKDKRQKTQLIADIHGLIAATKQISKYSKEFESALSDIIKNWDNIDNNLKNVANHTTLDELKDMSAFMEKLKLKNAQASWKRVATTAEKFKGTALARFKNVGS